MVVSNFQECRQQILKIIRADYCFEISSTRTQWGNVLSFNLFAAGAAQVLQGVRYQFPLDYIQQTYFDFGVIVKNVALRA